MNNNRKTNQPIRLTEQDLHFLVEEAVRGYLRENGMQEGVWGGLKNIWNGVKQGNFNVGTTYKTGNWASSFQKYEQQVQGIIQKMQQVAQKSGNQQVVSDLAAVSKQFSTTAQAFNQMAQNAANTKPQFSTQVNSGFANNPQAQGQAQQQQGQQQQGQVQQQQNIRPGSYNKYADQAEMPTESKKRGKIMREFRIKK